jgi:hypothetical protein
MKSLKHLIAAGLIATAGAAALTLPVYAAAEDTPHFAGMWADTIAKMTPEDRAKLTAMQDKILQMEMEQKTMNAKMDMDIAKAKRDMEMWVTSKFFTRGQ